MSADKASRQSSLSMFRMIMTRFPGHRKRRFRELSVVRIFIGLFESVTVVWIAGFASWLIDIGNIRDNRLFRLMSGLMPGVIPEDPDRLIVWSTLILLLIILIRSVLQGVSIYLSDRFATELQSEFGLAIVGETLKRPYSWFVSREASDLIQTYQWRSSIGTFLQLYLGVQTQIVVMAFLVTTLFLVDFLLTFSVILIMILLALFFHSVIRPELDTRSAELKKVRQGLFREISASIHGGKDVRIHNAQGSILKGLRSGFSDVIRLSVRKQLALAAPSMTINVVCYSLLVLTVLLVHGRNPHQLQSILSRLSMVAIVSWRVLPMVQRLQEQVGSMRTMFPHIESVLEFLEGDESFPAEPAEEKDKEKEKEKDAVETGRRFGSLVVSELEFSYPEGPELYIPSISLKIDRGEKVGIIGSSGTGKSTFLDLLFGLLEPTGGEIGVIDDSGNPLASGTWSRLSGYMPQSPYIFPGSVDENIALCEPGHVPDTTRLEEALREAEALELRDELVERKGGLRGGGMNISGGQAQRIVLARMLYADREVLFIDEGTSNLDIQTEKRVLEPLLSASEKTVIMATHRLETLSLFDRVIWLEDRRLMMDDGAATVVEAFRRKPISRSDPDNG